MQHFNMDALSGEEKISIFRLLCRVFKSDKQQIRDTGAEFKNVACLCAIETAGPAETPLLRKIKATDPTLLFV